MILSVLILINAMRVHPLVETAQLDKLAQTRAEYLCTHTQWSHEGWLDSFKGVKYKYAGENLAKGFSNEMDTAKAWLNSPTHRAVMLNEHYTKIGIGHSCGIEVNLFLG